MSSKRLEAFAVDGIPLVQPGDDLGALIIAAIEHSHLTPVQGDVVVVAQKIVSKAENRIVKMSSIKPSERALKIAAEINKDPAMVELVLSESKAIIATGNNVLIVEDKRGFILANAGIDRSNIEDSENRALLLPEDANASAAKL